MKAKTFFSVAAAALVAVVALPGCATGPKAKVKELENKGTSMGVPTPDWIKTYTAKGITAVQAQPEYKDKYCVIGEESGVNKQFVLTWADNFSAQQRIGAMLRTTIASEYQARVQANAQSTGGANSSSAQGAGSGEYKQEIDNSINAIVNVSYSGAQREADWWSLRRRYDPDQKDLRTDEYTAYVLYTIPKAELNRQVAQALQTSVSKDSELYAITISMAQDILKNGLSKWIEPTDSGSGSRPASASQSSRQGGGDSHDYVPRIRATEGGAPVNMYIARAEFSEGFLLVYLTTEAIGDMSSPYWYNGWSSNVVLQDLDNPARAWKSVRWTITPESPRFWVLSFENASGRRFSLTDNNRTPAQMFSEFAVSGK